DSLRPGQVARGPHEQKCLLQARASVSFAPSPEYALHSPQLLALLLHTNPRVHVEAPAFLWKSVKRPASRPPNASNAAFDGPLFCALAVGQDLSNRLASSLSVH